MRVLHNVEDALAVAAASAKAVDEVGQTVFVQGSREQHAHSDGCHHGYAIGQIPAAEVERSSHHASREPSRERPEFDHCLVTFLRGLIESPEGQSCEEDEGRIEAVVPMGAVYVDFHSFRNI